MSPLRRNTQRRHGVKRLAASLCLVWSSLFSHAVSAEVAVEQVLEGLHVPSGIAIPPGNVAERYEVFVTESGRGRVVMFLSDRPSLRPVVIKNLPTSMEAATSANQPPRTGPLGLVFLDEHRLVMGLGDEDAAGFLLYELGGRAVPVAADEPTQTVEFPSASADQSAVESVQQIARTRANDHVADMLIASCTGDDGATMLWKIPVRAGTLGEASPFVARDSNSSSRHTPALTITPQGYVVAVENTVDDDEHRWLTFYHPAEGEVVLRIALELPAVVGLAYSPGGNLYALDFGASDSKPGGVYRVDEASEPGKPAVSAVKIADVPRPTALAFGRDGALYVTALGDPDDGDSENGVVLKITGEL
jgi:hypothetical protein